MITLVRFLRLLSLVLWIGGIAFFAFVVAPVAFGKLPSPHEAGLVVGGTLRILHILGLACGALFLALTLALSARLAPRRTLIPETALILAMLAVTAYSQFHILPAMEIDRQQAGADINALDSANPSRLHFEALHRLSEQIEGAVLFGGLALLFLVAAEPTSAMKLESGR